MKRIVGVNSNCYHGYYNRRQLGDSGGRFSLYGTDGHQGLDGACPFQRIPSRGFYR